MKNKIVGEIHFENNEQAAIWKHFILGQLSDGQYENDSSTDWIHWHSLKIIVDGTLGWKRYDDHVPTRLYYDFWNDIYDPNFEEVLEIVRAHRVLGGDPTDELISYLANLPYYDFFWTSEHKEELRKRIEEMFGGKKEALKLLNKETYTLEDLERDFEAITKSVNTSLRPIGYLS